MKRIHSLLAIQSLVAILVSLNRHGMWTLGYVLPNEFLRWMDFNNMLISAGIFANLRFEEIGLDLNVVALLAVLSVHLLWKRGRQPLFIYYTAAYWLGLIASFIAQAR